MSQGESNRDRAIEGIARKGEVFMSKGMVQIANLPKDHEFTGEDIRVLLNERGIHPHHSNAWGALIMNAIRNGMLIDTGRVRKMKTPKSHARKTTIYLKV